MTVVEEAWTALRLEGRAESGWHVRRIYRNATCEILAGVRQPGASPGLLLEVGVEDIPSGLTFPQSRGFAVDSVLLDGGAVGRARFALSLADPAYEAVFAVLCEDTAAAANAAARRRQALRDWVGRLHVWQEFMARHGSDGLSDAAIIGLYGELWFLRDRLAPRAGFELSIDAWSGPLGEPNDFALPRGFVEVKTTTRQAPELIEISDVDQLDDRRGRIVLAHVRLQSNPQGESLVQLVSSVRAVAAADGPGRLQRLNDLLLAAGYLDAHADQYTRTWHVSAVDLYSVADGFPRLRRDDMRAGVRNCRYVIEVSACAAHVVDGETLHALIQEGGNG
ncbi:MAG: PD-(D/E)XK motif protein [Burkholderiales bacterium]